MGFFSKLVREVKRPFKQTEDEFNRFKKTDIGKLSIIAGGAILGGGIGGAALGGAAGTATGVIAGAGIAAFGVKPSFGSSGSSDFPVQKPFALPTNFPLVAATGHLSRTLAKRRARARTNITGGISGSFGADIRAPRLETI